MDSFSECKGRIFLLAAVNSDKQGKRFTGSPVIRKTETVSWLALQSGKVRF